MIANYIKWLDCDWLPSSRWHGYDVKKAGHVVLDTILLTHVFQRVVVKAPALLYPIQDVELPAQAVEFQATAEAVREDGVQNVGLILGEKAARLEARVLHFFHLE